MIKRATSFVLKPLLVLLAVAVVIGLGACSTTSAPTVTPALTPTQGTYNTAIEPANFVSVIDNQYYRWVSVIGGALCLLALAILIVQRAMTSLKELWVLLTMVGLSFLTEVIYRKRTGRTIKSSCRTRLTASGNNKF